MKLDTIINIYLRQIAATRRIEFYAPEKMSPKLKELITQVEAEINYDGVSQKFENADDFLNDLKK